MIFGLELAKHYIYNRIVLELAQGFRALGHECVLVDPSTISSVAGLYELYAKCDWVLVTNDDCFLSQKIGESFLFESLPLKIIFLHHDALSGNYKGLQEIQENIEALIRIKDRSIHFSIEKGDVLALNHVGITCYPIAHINTMGIAPSQVALPTEKPNMQVSFVGHVVPPINGYILFGFDDMEYYLAAQVRLSDFTHDLRDRFSKNDAQKQGISTIDVKQLSARVQYLLFVNDYTVFMRGNVLQALNRCAVDIFGGDPAWIHGLNQERNLTFTDPHIRNYKPVLEINDLTQIFRNSRINLNITSLQFDTAVINRVIDCYSVGGFMLTDKKPQLAELTDCADQISYSSIEELQAKAAYFINPDHESERRSLIEKVRADFLERCSVERCIRGILEKIA